MVRTFEDEDGPVWPDDDPLDPEVEGTYAWQVAELESWIPARIEFARSMPSGTLTGALVVIQRVAEGATLNATRKRNTTAMPQSLAGDTVGESDRKCRYAIARSSFVSAGTSYASLRAGKLFPRPPS